MAITITMPALSPTMEEGSLAKWLVKVGDSVSAGDVLAEVETDKAVMEIEAIDDGTVAKLLIPDGTTGVKINTPIALIAEDGEDLADITASQPTQTSEPQANQSGGDSSGAAPASAPSPPASNANAPGSRAGSAQTPHRISPLARRVARDKGIDTAHLTGSGPHGRIVMRDLDGESATPATPALAQGGAVGDGLGLDARIYAPDSYDLVPMDAMGRAIAERLTASAMSIPHYTVSRSLCLDNLLAARRTINEMAGDEIKVSVTDMLIKAAGLALMRVPECNVSYVDGARAWHKAAHVSLAVALDGSGLITPVIRDAHMRGLADISAAVRDLATRARARKLVPEEYAGGTFSLSNLGMFGVESFTSILNPPEAMILSVGAGVARAVPGADGTIVAKTMMDVTLTSDHRVVSGAQAAQWLAVFANMVAHPEIMLV